MPEAETITISVSDGDGAPREITCRRPTHAELDVLRLQRLLAAFHQFWRELRKLTDEAPEGGAVRYANLLGLIDEAAQEVRARVRRALAATAGSETLAWYEAGDELSVTQRATEIAFALVLALAPPSRVPKS